MAGCAKKCSDLFNFTAEATHRIELFSYTTVETATGGQDITAASLGDLWAAMRPTSGRELFIYGDLKSRVSSVVTIRYNATFKNTRDAAKYYIEYDGRVFAVKYIKNLDDTLKSEGKDYQQLIVEENEPEFT